jgi:hypothetical protein
MIANVLAFANQDSLAFARASSGSKRTGEAFGRLAGP